MDKVVYIFCQYRTFCPNFPAAQKKRDYYFPTELIAHTPPQLQFVHRSSAACLSPVTAVEWAHDYFFLIGYESGLIEVVDVSSRRPVHSLCGSGTSVVGISTNSTLYVFVQFKSQEIRAYSVNIDYSQWTMVWSVASPTAVSFARPVVQGNKSLIAVTAGQSTISILDVETGSVIGTSVDMNKLGQATGMVVSMCQGERDRVLILMESGHIKYIDPEDRSVGESGCISIPGARESDYVLPTCMASVGTDILVGTSDGWIQSLQGQDRVNVGSGVGAIVAEGGEVYVGTWKGALGTLNIHSGAYHHFRSPHASSITCMSSRGGIMAVGSTDGRVSFWSTS